MAAPMPLLAPVTAARIPSSDRSNAAKSRLYDAAMPRRPETVAGAAQFACVLEVSAEKPGNITPSHDFEDTSFEDMLQRHRARR